MTILYYLLMFFIIGGVALFVYDKLVHPALFKEELEETLEEAAEEKVRREAKKQAEKILKE